MLNRSRHRQFHEAVLRQLYPPQHNDEDDGETREIISTPEIQMNVQSEDDINVDVQGFGSDYGESDSSESVGQHLTRAQRKRIRQNKLKEVASNSKNKFSTEAPKRLDVEGSHLQSQSGCNTTDMVKTLPEPIKELDFSAFTSRRKLKRRRFAKKLNQDPEKSIQREQLGKIFTAESCGDGFVLKHV